MGTLVGIDRQGIQEGNGMDRTSHVRIGTRASALARTQTEWVAAQIRAWGFSVVTELVTTRGDVVVDVPIAGIAGGDGVFVRELERALLDGRIDAAVHSFKDLPTAETPGLSLACVPCRASPFDAFLGRSAPTLEELPAGAVVGTSSIRRVMQIRLLRPDLAVRSIRGNIDTRLGLLDKGQCDGLILAAAGLERLGLVDRITQILRPDGFWPAVAQGALVVQIRQDDARMRSVVAPLDDPETHAAVRAERACLAALAGGCLAPIAAWARSEGGVLGLGACVFEARGESVERIDSHGVSADAGEKPEDLGGRVAGELLRRGAAGMIARARLAGGATAGMGVHGRD